MPRNKFRNPYTGEEISADEFANMGDPNGNLSAQEELQWAQDYFGRHPELSREDEFISAHNGQVKDNRSWLDRNSGKIAGIGALALPAAVFAAPALASLGGGSGTTAGAAGATGTSGIPSLSVTSGLTSIPGTTIAAPTVAGTVPSLSVTSGLTSMPGTAVAAPTAPGGSMLGKIFDFGKKYILGDKGEGLEGLAKALGAAGDTSASNRGAQLAALMDQDRLRLEAEQERRNELANARRELAYANFIQNGGSGFDASALGLPDFNFKGAAGTPSDAQKQAAAEIEQEMLRRVAGPGFQLSRPGEGPYAPLMKPGKGEKLLNIFSPVFAGAGSIYRGTRSGNR